MPCHQLCRYCKTALQS